MRTGKKLLMYSAAAIAIGVPVGVAIGSEAQDGAEPSPGEVDQEVADTVAKERTGLPAIVVLETCLDIQARDGQLPSTCAEVIADEEEIRAAAKDLPPEYPTPEDYGLDEAEK